jgi:type II secretory pathway pseudopilin PulG
VNRTVLAVAGVVIVIVIVIAGLLASNALFIVRQRRSANRKSCAVRMTHSGI